jgi:hypothetical protein
VANLALFAKKRIKESEREFLWDTFLPPGAYGLWARPLIGAIASVLLLIAALRNNWKIALAVIGR